MRFSRTDGAKSVSSKWRRFLSTMSSMLGAKRSRPPQPARFRAATTKRNEPGHSTSRRQASLLFNLSIVFTLQLLEPIRPYLLEPFGPHGPEDLLAPGILRQARKGSH